MYTLIIAIDDSSFQSFQSFFYYNYLHFLFIKLYDLIYKELLLIYIILLFDSFNLNLQSLLMRFKSSRCLCNIIVSFYLYIV